MREQTKLKSILSKEQMSIFDGIMLSDGHVSKLRNNNSNSHFIMEVKYRSFVEKVKEILPLAWSRLKRRRHCCIPNTKIYETWSLVSKADLFLTEQRHRWYSRGKKIVPRDVKLTPLCLLWWYIGDGHLARRKRQPGLRRITLATNGFYQKDINLLIGLLRDKIGNESVHKQGEGEIAITRSSLCRFIKQIGLCSPVPEYKYKFEFGQYTDPNYFEKYSIKYRKTFGKRTRTLNSKLVICVETGKIFKSIVEASKYANRSDSAMSWAVNTGSPCARKHYKILGKPSQ